MITGAPGAGGNAGGNAGITVAPTGGPVMVAPFVTSSRFVWGARREVGGLMGAAAAAGFLAFACLSVSFLYERLSKGLSNWRIMWRKGTCIGVCVLEEIAI